MKTAYLFTGQGFQYEGMLKELPKCKLTESMLSIATDILEEQVINLDSKEALKSNRNVQLCIYISEVILGSFQIQKLIPDYVVGHSIGAFSAATISGALDFKDGLQLVDARGKAMENSYPSVYGMMAVTGLTPELLEQILAKFNDKISSIEDNNIKNNKIYISNINTKEQIVLSGALDSLKQADKYLKMQYSVKTQFLQVNVPSHCELMLQVSDILAEEMKKIQLRQVNIPYIMNTTARRTRNIDMISKDLISGVSKPVYWYDSLSILYELGTMQFLEISQSDILTNIGKKAFTDTNWRKLNLSSET